MSEVTEDYRQQVLMFDLHVRFMVDRFTWKFRKGVFVDDETRKGVSLRHDMISYIALRY